MNWKKFAVPLLALAGSVLCPQYSRPTGRAHSTDFNAARTRTPERREFFRSSNSEQVIPHIVQPSPADPARIPQPSSQSANVSLPITFEPNVGQADARVQFIGRGKGIATFLTSDAVVLRRGEDRPLQLRFEGECNPAARCNQGPGKGRQFGWAGEEQLRGRSNYLIENNPRQWHRNVPHFARATAGVAPGVKASIYGGEQGVEYDLELAPGIDPSKLRIALDGTQSVRLSASGDLLMLVGSDEVEMKKPRAYQKGSSGQHRARRKRRRRSPSGKAKPQTPKKRRRKPVTARPVGAAYVLEADGSIGFRVGPHDPKAALVIDPVLSVAYASFLGGSGTDVASSVALDSSGKMYVGGTTTSSTSFPEGLGNRVGPADGPSEFFIAKIDPTVSGPNSLIYLTFLGGSGKQSGGQIAVDSSGDVAITGTTTSVDFPVTDTTQPTNGLTSGDGNDVIVSEIDPTGTKLMFSTIFGGSGAESLNGTGGIALDSSGDVYIASDTNTTPLDSASTDLPVTTNAYQTMWDGQTSDGFLAVFSPPAQAGGAATLKYCSYLGTNAVGAPGVGGIAVDNSGSAYIAGFAANTVSGFPVKNAFQTAYGGGTADAFLMKISPLGEGTQDLVYATELGGSGEDEALAVAVDSANPPNAYVAGLTQSSNFPTNGSVAGYQSVLHVNATSNAFLSVISQNAGSGMTALAYSTYLGGSSSDAAQSVSVGASNAVYVAGSATSYDFPWKDNLQPFNGASDAFVAKIDPTSSGAASLIYATPLGGTSPPGGTAGASANAVATDGAGHAYVAGVTTSGNFPTAVTTSGAISGFQPNCSSCSAIGPVSDAFVGEIAEAAGQSPSVTFTLAHLNFPGGSTAPQFVGIVNAGESGLTISSISLIGANAPDFSIGQSPCVGAVISPGPQSPCGFEVSFTPSTVGPETAEVVVTDNAPGSPQVFELTGAGGNGPLAAVSPASVNFGNQPENTTSATSAVVYFQNVGDEAITLSNFAMGGADPAQFPFGTSGANGYATCGGKNYSVPPGGTCVVQVSFEPSAQGAFQAELDFFDNSGGATNAEQVVELTGTGVATAPIASVTPQSWSFGSLTVGASGAAQTFQLMNKGSAALSVSSIGLTGTNAADFSIASTGTTCPLSSGSLPIGGTCNVAVQFAPQTAGSKNASLTFADNAAGSPQQVALSGTATAPASLVVSPSNLTFAAQSEGTTSAAQSVTVSNMGNGPAGVSPLTISGTNAGDFYIPSPNPCATIAAGKSCQISVTFSPSAASPPGARSATLNVGGGSPSTVALSGTATQASISVPTNVKFADQLAGTAGTAVPVVVTNNSSGAGGGALNISSVSISESGNTTGDFSVTADSCTGPTTPPGATCSIQVTFQPASQCPTITSQRTATLTISDNAPGSPHTVPLSGTALDFCVTIQPGQNPPQPISPGGTVPPFNMEIQSSDTAAGSAQLACSAPAAMLGGCMIATTPASNPPVVQITSANPGLFAMTVTSTAPGTASGTVAHLRGAPPWEGMLAVWCMTIAFLGWFVLQRLARRRNWASTRDSCIPRPAIATVILFGTLIGVAACGGGSAGTTASDPAPGSPAGSYAITVTATITVGQATVTRTFVESVMIEQQQ